MPYDIKNYKGTSVASVTEGTVNSQTPLKLIGQNYKNYGSLIAENFVHIVENFARDVAPTNAMVGQLWYKPTDGYLYILDKDAAGNQKWKSLATIEVSSVDPTQSGSAYTPREGDFWFNSATDKGILNIRFKDDDTGGMKWGQLSVPVSSDATLLFQNVNDDTAVDGGTTAPKTHATIKFVVDNKVLAMFSSSEKAWTPNKTVKNVNTGGTATVYGIETHPDGTALHEMFPYVQTGLTMAQPYDPDISDSGTSIAGYEYGIRFSAPAAGGTRAEGYPIIDYSTGNPLGVVDSIVITNAGSGYTGAVTAHIDAGQNGGTAATLSVDKGTGDNDDKVDKVNVTSPGSGYYTPARKPTLNGSIRVGENKTDFIDLRGLASGFGRSITDITIVGGGSGYTAGSSISFAAGTGGTGATGWQIATVDGSGKILTITKGEPGTGFTYAPSTANSGITIAGGGSNASLLAVLGDNRLILDSNAISGDKIHAGNISAFESSAISDLTMWQWNDPGIAGLTVNDGQSTANSGYGGTALGGSDNSLSAYTGISTGEYNSASGGSLTIDANSTSAVKRLAGYAEVAFERDQTLGSSNTTQAANGALRVKGGAHIQKNLHVDGSISVKGSINSFGAFNNIETNNLQIEDNLIELNKSQSDLGNSSAFGGVSGLYIDRGKTGANVHVKKAIMLWDDTNDDFGDPDYWKFGTVGDGGSSTGITENETPGSTDPDLVSGFELIELDTRLVMASQGGKLDIVSDNRDRSGSNSGRSKGGHLTKYNGFAQDITSTKYPYNDANDFIIVDQDERILRGEFHFYRDAYPCDGSDLTSSDAFPSANMNQGGISSTKVGGDVQITFAGSNVSGTGATYMIGSGGPNFQSGPTVSGAVTVSGNAVTAGGNFACASGGFLDDPVWLIDTDKAVVSLFREGRSIGWRRPRIILHDSAGTGAYAIPSIDASGAQDADATVLTKGKYYASTTGAIVGEANDTVTAKSGPATGGNVSVTLDGGTISAVTRSGNGTNFRKQKPFKEINSTKFNGAFCADPAQGDIDATNKLAHTPYKYRSATNTDGDNVADSDNKFVGVYPVMDGHNDVAITSETFPYNGAGMTIGTQHHHFIDTYTRNIRVENPHNSTEELTILSRNTNLSGTSAKAKVNIVATNANGMGDGDILVRAQSGNHVSDASGTGNVVIEARSNKGASTSTLQTATGGGTSYVYLKASGSAEATGGTSYPYAASHSEFTGNNIYLQADQYVKVANTAGTGQVKRFEVHATDCRLGHGGDIHFGDGNIDSSKHFTRKTYFKSDVGTHIFPSSDNALDLGATDYETRVADQTGAGDTGSTDRRWRTLYVANISSGSNATTGTITGDWSLTSGSTFQATYTADLAERYEADEALEPGTVVAMGGDKEITATTKENDAEAFGVISTEPGFLLNGAAGDDTTHPKVAMVGRVPCKVKGKINKGDRLVSSSTKGRARKADLTKDSVFAIIGRALESHDSSGEGTIEIAVTRN